MSLIKIDLEFIIITENEKNNLYIEKKHEKIIKFLNFQKE